MVHIAQAEEDICLRESSSKRTGRRKSFLKRLSLRTTKDEVQLRHSDSGALTERPSTKKKHVIKARRSLSGSKGKKLSRENFPSVHRGKSLPTEDLDTTVPESDRRPSMDTAALAPRSRPKRKAGTIGRRGALQVGHATAAVEEGSGPVGTVPLEKRHRILQELRDTERSYATSLHMVNVVFMAPLRAKVGTEEEILSASEITEIFGSLETIQEESQDLWERIDLVLNPASWSESTLIGPLFLDLAQNQAFSKAYHEYVTTYERGLALIRQASREETDFGEFMTSRQLPCDSHSLSSLLILPIQRIPRYQLLLRDLIKATPHDHPDQPLLISALEQFQCLTSSLDEQPTQ